MSVEGSLRVRFDSNSDQLGIVIQTDRPVAAARILEGLTPADAERRVPMLYALCGRSQRLAAREALAAACASAVPDDKVHLEMLSEAAQEYLWRFFIDLPQQMDGAPDVASYAPLRKALIELPGLPQELWLAELDRLEAVWREHVFGMPLERWRDLSHTELVGWLSSGATDIPRVLSQVTDFLDGAAPIEASIAHLPRSPDSDWLRETATCLSQQASYGLLPEWRGQALEAGAWARQQQMPLITRAVEAGFSPVLIRFLARLLELIELLEAMRSVVSEHGNPRCGSLTVAPQCGLGWVHTARGLLMHRVEVRDEVVTRYQVLAPTEWNFHPHGALFEGLRAWREQLGQGTQQNSFERWVGLQVLSLDPCVQYQIEVNHA